VDIPIEEVAQDTAMAAIADVAARRNKIEEIRLG